MSTHYFVFQFVYNWHVEHLNNEIVSTVSSAGVLHVIVHFTVVCLATCTWPMNESEAGVDLVLIEISLLFLRKFLLISMTTTSLT